MVVSGTVVLVLALGAMPAARVAAAPDLAGLVNPFNGTQPGAPDFGTGGGAGNTFPGPVLPFGMMQWGPDTSPSMQNAGGGYAYNDTKIRGLSLRRMSGAGCANGGDVPILPTTRAVVASPVKRFATSFSDDLLPAFAHNDEAASPGYYRVGLDPGTPARIDARLTATTRSGLARLSYPATRTASVLVNAAGSRTGNSAGDVHVDPARREITGSTSSGGFCLAANTYRVFFVARFNRAFNSFGTWTRQALAPGSTSAHDAVLMTPASSSGRAPTAQAGGYATFDTTADRVVELRVGMSFVSVDNARHNLDAETAGVEVVMPESADDGFFDACRLEDLPPGKVRTVEVDGEPVCLVNTGEAVCAVGDICPHAWVSLGGGNLDGFSLKCPGHNAHFDVRTGEVLDGPPDLDPDERLETYAVRVEDGVVRVSLTTPTGANTY